MTWRDRLRPASFRGVPFFIESTDVDLGRRVEVLRFPGREDVVGQDLGKDAASFSVSGYVIGGDYDRQREELEAALLTPGPGTLVHPSRGELLVLVHDRIRVRESKDRGGQAVITFSCTVSTPAQPRFAGVNAAASAVAKADTATEAVAQATERTVTTTGLPSSAVSPAIALLSDMADVLTLARTTIGTVVDDVSTVIEVEERLVTEATALLAAPGDLATLIAGAFFDLFEDAAAAASSTGKLGSAAFDASLIGERKRIVRTVRRAVGQIIDGTETTTIDDTTAISEAETTNLKALDAMFRVSALSAYAHAIPSMPWTSYQEASAASTELLAWFDEVEPNVDDDTYAALRDLRVSIARYLEVAARSLPYLRDHVPAAETSTILLAHELYGDARRESEIVARNPGPDPGYLNPSQTLEVASA